MMALDLTLAISLIVVAVSLLGCRDLFQSIVLFISFGFLMSLAWVRLNAPDIALAEAAIGSAVSGTLFLAALGEFRLTKKECRLGSGALALFGWLLVAAGLAFAVASLPKDGMGLREAVAQRVDETGVKNPVTAVLLSFRGYDTLLEIAVLLVAAVAVLAQRNRMPAFMTTVSGSPVLWSSARHLLPLIALVAGYLLWVGAYAPGGAFQAGAVLAGAATLASLSDPAWMDHIHRLCWRLLFGVGLLVFVGVAGGTVLAGGSLLEYRGVGSKWLILMIETAATISIGATLLVLVVGRGGSSASEHPL